MTKRAKFNIEVCVDLKDAYPTLPAMEGHLTYLLAGDYNFTISYELSTKFVSQEISSKSSKPYRGRIVDWIQAYDRLGSDFYRIEGTFIDRIRTREDGLGGGVCTTSIVEKWDHDTNEIETANSRYILVPNIEEYVRQD